MEIVISTKTYPLRYFIEQGNWTKPYISSGSLELKVVTLISRMCLMENTGFIIFLCFLCCSPSKVRLVEALKV
jgi:hypothetical protein